MAHYHEPREGGISIGLVLGIILAVVLVFALLWFVMAANDTGVATPGEVPNEPRIENPSGGPDRPAVQPQQPGAGTNQPGGGATTQPTGPGTR